MNRTGKMPLLQCFGNNENIRIKQIHVKRLYADLLEKGYSPGTIRAYHIILSECLQAAVDSDMIRKNPAKGSRKGMDKEVSKKEL